MRIVSYTFLIHIQGEELLDSGSFIADGNVDAGIKAVVKNHNIVSFETSACSYNTVEIYRPIFHGNSEMMVPIRT